MSEKWISVKETARLIGVTDRTVWRYVSQGKLSAKKEGRRLIVDSDSVTDLISDQRKTDSDQSKDQTQELIDQLRSENEYLRRELAETKERSDTIILGLTQQNQLLLEDKSTPWYKRMFGKRKGDDRSGQK